MSSSSVQLQPQFVQQYVPFPGFSPIEYMSPPIALNRTTLLTGVTHPLAPAYHASLPSPGSNPPWRKSRRARTSAESKYE